MTNENNIEKKDFSIDAVNTNSNNRRSSNSRRKRKINFLRNSKVQRTELSILMTGVVILLITIPLFTFLVDVIKKILEPVY